MPVQPISGHVFRAERKRGPVWYAKYRLPDGRQVQRKIGPAWTGRGRPLAGSYTKRTAEEWLRGVLDQAREGTLPGMVRTREGTLPGMVRTGATFADAVAEFLRYSEQDRGCKPWTIHGYTSVINAHLIPAFGKRPVEDITTAQIERWIASVKASPRTRNKLLILMHGILKRARKVWGLSYNAAAGIEKFPQRPSGDIDVFSSEEVRALVRAAESEQDAAIFLTAAFTGMRQGELLALRWRDVDFAQSVLRVRASYGLGQTTAPKSGKVRPVPLAPDVAKVLARLSRRELCTDEDDLVFLGDLGGHVDSAALRRRYKRALERAGLRQLRFHDLRHTFGTRMIAKADIRRVQEWMGHADIQTTMRYLHYAPREEDARLVAEVFAVPVAEPEVRSNTLQQA